MKRNHWKKPYWKNLIWFWISLNWNVKCAQWWYRSNINYRIITYIYPLKMIDISWHLSHAHNDMMNIVRNYDISWTHVRTVRQSHLILSVGITERMFHFLKNAFRSFQYNLFSGILKKWRFVFSSFFYFVIFWFRIVIMMISIHKIYNVIYRVRSKEINTIVLVI